MSAIINLVWFRRDLRLADHEAVAQATATGNQVLPFFVIDPWFYQQPEIGSARVTFLFESLANLDHNLRSLGGQLYLFSGDTVEVIQKFTQQFQDRGYTAKLYFNRDVQTEYGIERDCQILQFYRDSNLEVHLGLNNFLQTTGDDRKQWYGQYYNYQRQLQYPPPTQIQTPTLDLHLPRLTFAQLHQDYAPWCQSKSRLFTGGETEANETLNSFLGNRFRGYHWKLSRPLLAQKGATSHLSPYLAMGCLSTRQVYQATKARVEQLQDQPKDLFSLKAFRDRLRWRDSFTQRLYYFPELVHTNCYQEFDQVYHNRDLTGQQQEYFTAWQEGKTGFHLVDASMRQLKTLGWMNFRMRAMCANFLTVICGVPWQKGAKHYLNYLVHADLAIDHWQWQMQAGVTNPSGTFRIYNPTKNLQEKDKNLEFIWYWLPELRAYNLSEVSNQAYLGKSDYPAPMLDYQKKRRVNGKVISDLRKQVKQRLEMEGGDEYERAVKAKETIEKYWQVKDKQYQEYKQRSAIN
jgi:deoxyribodipyrimidine photo-lyase